MIPANSSAKVILNPVASVTNASKYLSFDRGGYDYLTLDVILGTGNTQTAVVTGLKISESDTVTSASSMTDIAALCCSNTTSTSAVNAVPGAAYQGLGGIVMEFQIDLKARKRYIGLTIATDTVQTAVVAAVARLTRGTESRDTAAQQSVVLNKADTAAIGCMQIVAN